MRKETKEDFSAIGLFLLILFGVMAIAGGCTAALAPLFPH